MISGAAVTIPRNAAPQTNDGFAAFWQKFKTAVTRVDKETVVSLTGFPMRTPGRVRNIKDAADLRLRYRDVFNNYANAAKCFANESPMEDPNNPKQRVISCFDNKGNGIDYVFARDKTDWKFVKLDKYELPRLIEFVRLVQPRAASTLDSSRVLSRRYSNSFSKLVPL